MFYNSSQNSYKYLGAVHIHSTLSDGTGTLSQIVSSAKKAGLDWIIVTDHNHFDMEEGFIDGVCVIKGEEISPEFCNHYVALGINEEISPEIGAEAYVQEVRHQGGFGFCAHPDESTTRNNPHKPIRWLDKNITPDGVEIWNWFSTWADNYSSKNLFTLAWAYLFRHNLITKPKEETLKWWDELNNQTEKIIPAIGGVDAHALKVTKYLVPVKIFPYEEMFKTITNIITLEEALSDDFNIAKAQILNALKDGNNLIVNRKISKKIPEIKISNNSRVASCHLTTVYDSNILKIQLDKVYDIRLLCNGAVVWAQRTKEAEIPLTQSGKYRLEASKGKLGYLYSNPVFVKI